MKKLINIIEVEVEASSSLYPANFLVSWSQVADAVFISIQVLSGFFSMDIQMQSIRKQYVLLSQLSMPVIKVYNTVDSQISHTIPSSKNAADTIICYHIIEFKESILNFDNNKLI